MPSLKQLNEAVMAYMAENPDALITVVVDATFGHRIDSKEVAEFDAAVSNNEIVAPPAGAIGRGDAFVLSIANKVNADDPVERQLPGVPRRRTSGCSTRVASSVASPCRTSAGCSSTVCRCAARPAASRSARQSAGERRRSRRQAPRPASRCPFPQHRRAGATLQKPGRGRDSPGRRGTRRNMRADTANDHRAAQVVRGSADRADTKEHRNKRPACIPDVRRTSHAGQQRQRDRRELLARTAPTCESATSRDTCH